MSADPIRADYKFLKEILSISFSSAQVSPTPVELDRVASVFKKAGGSWVRVFGGSAEDITLIKKIIKVAIDKNLLTKSMKWGD